MVVEYKILWSEKAINSLKAHYDLIALDSERAAKKVLKEILEAVANIPPYPQKYQLDEYYPNNPGNIRRLFRWSYRIIYEIDGQVIHILNVIHTSQEPSTT